MERIRELHENFPNQVAAIYLIYAVLYLVIIVYHFFGKSSPRVGASSGCSELVESFDVYARKLHTEPITFFSFFDLPLC